VRTVAVDLLDPEAVSRISRETADLEVGLLIYNAGANTCREPFLDAELTDVRRVIDLNLTRMQELVQHFGRPMRARGRGGILLVGSLAGSYGSMRQSVYSGVKAFGRLFAESLWLELREHGVDVLELVLGVTRTPAMQRAGLNFDVPGLSVSEPADVAREGLENLSNGPVFIAGDNAAAVHRASGPDRAAIVLGAHRTVQEILGRKGERA
jgi:short-subunit dehydrogenase